MCNKENNVYGVGLSIVVVFETVNIYKQLVLKHL